MTRTGHTDFSSWRTRSRRRKLVGGAVAALVIAAILLIVGGVPAVFVAAGLLSIALGCLLFLRHLVQALTEQPPHNLDERQLEHSRRYHFWAYRILAIVVSCLYIANMVVTDDRVLSTLPAIVMLTAALPTFVAGWLELDEPADDPLENLQALR